jgi:hypothetical protein
MLLLLLAGAVSKLVRCELPTAMAERGFEVDPLEEDGAPVKLLLRFELDFFKVLLIILNIF